MTNQNLTTNLYYYTDLDTTLTSFTGTSILCGVRLNWETTSEQNTNYYVIERSEDAINYSEILIKVCDANSTKGKSYTYTDYKAKPNTIVYYQITQIQYNGKTSKKIIVMNYYDCTNENNEIKIYINPVTNILYINVPQEGKRQLAIYKANGHKEEIMDLSKGNETKVNMNDWAAGIYMAIILENGKQVSLKKIEKK